MASQPAGRSDFQRDDDFHQRGSKNFSRTMIPASGTAILSGRKVKSLAGQRETQQGELQVFLNAREGEPFSDLPSLFIVLSLISIAQN